MSYYKLSRFNHLATRSSSGKLIFNGMTGSMVGISDQEWEQLKRSKKDNFSELLQEQIKGYLDAGILVDAAKDEVKVLENMHRASRYQTKAWSLTICPTIFCNFKCDYCFELHRPGKMSIEVQDALVNAVKARLKSLESFNITWYGGEPTTAWDVVKSLSQRFIEICDEAGVFYSAQMISNAYLLDKTKVEELEEMRISLVQITIDGNKFYHDSRRVLLSGKGSFDKIIQNLKGFLGKPCQASIRVNVDARNREGVHSLIDTLHEEGLGNQPNVSVYFAPVGTTTEQTHGVADFCFSRKDFSNQEPEFFKHAHALGLASIPFPSNPLSSCIAARPDGFVVQPDGSLHKCWDTVGQEEYAVGHLLRSSSTKESNEYHKWMSWDPFDTSGECSSCTWLPNCMGGCPLKVVHPEMDPAGKIDLHCTTFRFNSKDMLPLFEDNMAQGNKRSVRAIE